MITVVLTIHVLIVLALICVVLLQRSEGGALGMGGGGGGFMTGRGAATALTRTTSVLAALFFATSLALAIFADRGESDELLIQELTGSTPAAPGDGSTIPSTTADDLLRTLGTEEPAPADDTPPPATAEPEASPPPADAPAETESQPADEPPAQDPNR